MKKVILILLLFICITPCLYAQKVVIKCQGWETNKGAKGNHVVKFYFDMTNETYQRILFHSDSYSEPEASRKFKVISTESYKDNDGNSVVEWNLDGKSLTLVEVNSFGIIEYYIDGSWVKYFKY